MTDEAWEEQIAAVWAAADESDTAAILRAIDSLVLRRPTTDAAAMFEAASARDFAGLEEDAVVKYRRAIELGLDDERYPQAVIQLASTLRNLGEYDEAETALTTWLASNETHDYADAARAFLALTLVSAGEPTRAAQIALSALAPHLELYSRPVLRYTEELSDEESDPDEVIET